MVKGVVYRGIVLLPSEPVSRQAVKISQAINKFCGSEFVLNAETMMPHITVHQIALPAYNEPKLLTKVKAVAAQYRPQTIWLTRLITFLETGIWWDVERSTELYPVHQAVVKQTDLLRKWHIIDQHAPMLTGEVDIGNDRREMLTRWGNMLCMKTYNPHVTIASCHSVLDASAAIKSIPVERTKFVADALHVVEVGPFGTCTKVIGSFPFTGSEPVV